MYIKNIVIVGFTSYRDQSFDVPFSPGHNVIVGKNGSGKSNFFNAIQFVLSDKYSVLRPSERRDLLHAGAGAPVLSAFVEITFDNAEGRIVIPGAGENPIVRIRRTIGLQQDEYRVNDKVFSATEVRLLLESAGLSAANPYYIVEQGKIIHLTNMTEAERLDMVKEIAGTRVYEARRAESVRVLAEANERRTKINENLEKLRTRLAEVSSEREDFQKYTQLEHERRGLEYALYAKEHHATQAELIEIEKQGRTLASSHQQHCTKALEAHEKIGALEEQSRTLGREIRSLEQERQAMEQDHAAHVRSFAEHKLALEELDTNAARQDSDCAALTTELNAIEQAYEKGKKDLETRRGALEKAREALRAQEQALGQKESTLRHLQVRRGQRRLFSSRSERDSWLRDEMRRVQSLAATQNAELTALNEQEKALEALIQQDEVSITTASGAIASHTRTLETREVQQRQQAEQRTEMYRERRDLQHQMREAEARLRACKEGLDRQNAQWARAIGSHDVRNGLESLEEIMATLEKESVHFRRESVHGPVIHLIRCDPVFYTAVEVTAGMALFHIVVDSFETSRLLLDCMNRLGKRGRVTFLPLDLCMRTSRKGIPTTADVTPLVNHIECDARYQNVINELLGGTAVASSLAVAAETTKKYHCDAVTLDGDQVSRKGGISGGYAQNISRLTTFTRREALLKDCERATQDVAALQQKIDAMDTQHASSTLRLDDDRPVAEAQRAIQDGHREIRICRERITRNQAALLELESSRRTVRQALQDTERQQQELAIDTASDFKQSFTSQDEGIMETLLTQTTSLRSVYEEEKARVLTLETEIRVLGETLAGIQHRSTTLQERRAEVQALQARSKANVVREEKKRIETLMKELRDGMVGLDTQITKRTREKNALDETIQEQRSAGSALQRQAQHNDAYETYQTQHGVLRARLESIESKIQQLGAIPTDAGRAYSEWPMERIIAQLKKVGHDQRKLSHVNKRALEQYNNLSEVCTELEEKQTANDKERESIQYMMKRLDDQKDEAIQRTVKQVQYQFEHVFHELVTADGASAELLLVRRGRQEGGAREDSSTTAAVESYGGLRIRVSFGQAQPATELSQLSGGQKSLVALALIFSIQRCDPAPFYVFDEIDAALDEEYRCAVARVMAKQKEHAQYITATFKTQMLDVADKIYGISFRNRVSRIVEINRDEADRTLLQAGQQVDTVSSAIDSTGRHRNHNPSNARRELRDDGSGIDLDSRNRDSISRLPKRTRAGANS